MDSNVHPVLKQFLEYGCKDQRTAPVAFSVYMDLAEVRVVWDLQYEFCKDLDIIYLTGRENKTDNEPNVYLPLPASRIISPEWLLKFQRMFPTSNGVTLALKDADSTIVYYLISEGLVIPDPPETIQHKRATEERKRLLQAELRRKGKLIYETVKCKSNNEGSGT